MTLALRGGDPSSSHCFPSTQRRGGSLFPSCKSSCLNRVHFSAGSQLSSHWKASLQCCSVRRAVQKPVS